jgi:hypothetical protein
LHYKIASYEAFLTSLINYVLPPIEAESGS